MQREQKITLREMGESGPTRLIVYCGDYRCAHSVVINTGRWSDDVCLRPRAEIPNFRARRKQPSIGTHLNFITPADYVRDDVVPGGRLTPQRRGLRCGPGTPPSGPHFLSRF
jgi:hypothetical protein